MKNTLKKVFAFLFVGALAFTFFACDKKNTTETETKNPTPVVNPTEGNETKTQKPTEPANPTTPVATPTEPVETPTPTEVKEWDGAYVDEEDYKAYIAYDLDLLFSSVEDQLTAEQKVLAEQALEAAIDGIDEAQTMAEVREAAAAFSTALELIVPAANGIVSYMGLSQAEKTKILGILENYAVTCGTAGISLFENGGYVMYNERVTLGTENYITGYGFGTLAEGKLTAPLDYETNSAWKMYYHTYNASDPGTCNYLDDQGSEVGDFYGYIGASFWTNFMNEEKNGYDWVPELAVSEKPIAVDEDFAETGLSKVWKFEVRTGDNGNLKYSTLSTEATRAAYNNRPVALEDYEYPFKLLLTQSNGLYRGSELASSTSGAIAGAKEFYNATAEGFDEAAWANVGIRTYVDETDGKPYFEVTFVSAYSQFFAMYYISSSLYMPVPQSFVEDVCGVDFYLGFSTDGTLSPVDNSLTLGAYVLEQWDSNEQIVYKKNPNYVYATTKYAVEGVHIKVIEAAKEDPTAGIKEFLAGHIDAAGIPQDYLDQYKNDPRTRQTTGSSNFKLNVNACDQETWVELFGVNGTVTQTQEENYWELKPALSNKHFVRGLSYSIDRLSFSSARGSVPSVNFFSSAYMSDNENGISYNATNEHKAAVAQLLDDTDGYGYSLALARDYFRMALSELEADNLYTPGTKDDPTVIKIQIAWMYATHEENYHNEIKKFLEDSFNDDSVCGGVYKLEVEFWVGDKWSDVYYNKMMVGQFDIGFGSISGNTLDPLGFMEVLSSDQDISGSFTLNWGVNTNDPSAYVVVYDGLRWSYDALYKAANGSAIVSDAQNKPVYTFDYAGLTKTDEGYEGEATFTLTLPDVTELTVTDIALCNYAKYYSGAGYEEYYIGELDGYSFTATREGAVVTVKVLVTNEAVARFNELSGIDPAVDPDELYGYMGFDFYFDLSLDGETSTDNYESIDDYFN